MILKAETINYVKAIIVKSSNLINSEDEVEDSTMLIADAGLDSLSFINIAIQIEDVLGIDLRKEPEIFSDDISFLTLINTISTLANKDM